MNNMERTNRKQLLDRIGRVPKGIPFGWEKTVFAVGGLMYLGFSNRCSEKLIVISSQGQRVIDCKTNEKTYCDENYDEKDLVAFADLLGDETVPIAGDGGGGLLRYSSEGNALALEAPFWPQEQILFMPNYVSWHSQPEKCTVIFEDYELIDYFQKAIGNTKVQLKNRLPKQPVFLRIDPIILKSLRWSSLQKGLLSARREFGCRRRREVLVPERLSTGCIPKNT